MVRIPSLNAIASAIWSLVTIANRTVNATNIDGAAWSTHVSGQAPADTRSWNGTTVATPATAGVPRVAIEQAADFTQAAADKAWASGTRSLTVYNAVRSGSYKRYSGSISVASGFGPGDKTVTLTSALTDFNKAILLPGLLVAPNYVSSFGTTTSNDLTYSHAEFQNNTTVVFKNVQNVDVVSHTLSYAFFVLEFY